VAAAPLAKPILYGVVVDGARAAFLEDPAFCAWRLLGGRHGGGGTIQKIADDRVVIVRPEGPIEILLQDPPNRGQRQCGARGTGRRGQAGPAQPGGPAAPGRPGRPAYRSPPSRGTPRAGRQRIPPARGSGYRVIAEAAASVLLAALRCCRGAAPRHQALGEDLRLGAHLSRGSRSGRSRSRRPVGPTRRPPEAVAPAPGACAGPGCRGPCCRSAPRARTEPAPAPQPPATRSPRRRRHRAPRPPPTSSSTLTVPTSKW
jgi:hypothetical protein